MIDSLFQSLSTVQSGIQPSPKTIAAAATITPDTFITFITGTTALANITPPVQGSHMLCLIFTATNPSAMTTTGNIFAAYAPGTSSEPTLMFFNPLTGKYHALVRV